MYALGYNPIHCMNCNLEVRPERFDLDTDLIEAISYWRWIYGAVDALWLASGSYEQWAKDQLSDITSEVNREGRAVQGRLNDLHHCYYWYFQDQSADDFHPISHCPFCGNPLLAYTSGIFPQLVCENCMIATVGE